MVPAATAAMKASVWARVVVEAAIVPPPVSFWWLITM